MRRAAGLALTLLWIAVTIMMPLSTPGSHAADAVTFDRDQVTIEANGQRFDFQVELAVTPTQRQQGLMYRKKLASDHGMLFDFGRTSPVSMWMRNTFIPLDMLFIKEDGRIATIAQNTAPQSEAIIQSEEPVRAVLELPAGTSALLGIKPGDRVHHSILNGQ